MFAMFDKDFPSRQYWVFYALRLHKIVAEIRWIYALLFIDSQYDFNV